MATRPRAATKGTEIMCALEPLPGRLHRGQVEFVMQTPGVLTLIGAPRQRLTDPVGIESGAGRIARTERIVDQLRLSNGDVRREPGVQRASQLLDRERSLQCEVHDLAERVDAGVGSSRRCQRRRFTRQVMDRVAESRLDRRCAGLGLPARVIRSLVFEDELDVHRSTSSTSTMSAPSPWRGPIFRTRV